MPVWLYFYVVYEWKKIILKFVFDMSTTMNARQSCIYQEGKMPLHCFIHIFVTLDLPLKL